MHSGHGEKMEFMMGLWFGILAPRPCSRTRRGHSLQPIPRALLLTKGLKQVPVQLFTAIQSRTCARQEGHQNKPQPEGMRNSISFAASSGLRDAFSFSNLLPRALLGKYLHRIGCQNIGEIPDFQTPSRDQPGPCPTNRSLPSKFSLPEFGRWRVPHFEISDFPYLEFEITTSGAPSAIDTLSNRSNMSSFRILSQSTRDNQCRRAPERLHPAFGQYKYNDNDVQQYGKHMYKDIRCAIVWEAHVQIRLHLLLLWTWDLRQYRHGKYSDTDMESTMIQILQFMGPLAPRRVGS